MKPNVRLKYERTIRGWTQARVAQEIDTSVKNIGRWERGSSSPYPYFREKLCKLFGKNALELGFVEDEEPQTSGPVDSQAVVSSLYDPLIPPLPNEGRGLTGRQNLLNVLVEQLCSGRSLAMRGLPGVGKTALAITLIQCPEVLDTFYDGVLWAGLGPRPDISRHLSRWGMLLGLSSTETIKEHSAEGWALALHSAIGKRRMILVLDDVWELEAALALKVGGPHCVLIVTTRFPRIAARFAHESVYTINELSVDDGLALLEQFAPEAMAHDSEALRTLVREVGGLPLALTLLGKHLQTQAYSGKPRRLQAALTQLRDASRRLSLSEPQAPLERSPSLATDAPLSLQSIIAVSDQQLDEQGRLALRALSVFPARPNSFSEEAALAVSQATPETLDTLCDVGLLEYSGPDRYTLHQTIADYASTHLTEHIAGERLIAYTITYIERHATDYEALEQESGNILAGLKYAFGAGQYLKFVRGVILFIPFLMARGLYDLAKLHLQRAYQLTIWSGDTLATATIVLHLGITAYHQGEHNQARVYLHEGLTLAQESGNDALANEIKQWVAQLTA
ncbi:MAG TPA: NB-ARC domain-containing protein [Ktedonosporobacter sp.]|nr:NB-ARC domain-containing protein [Ktedonosporobacter sp.]